MQSSARSAFFALDDGVRATVAVEGHVFAGCARKDHCFAVLLEEVERGLDDLDQRVVCCDADDAQALLDVELHGYHAALAHFRTSASCFAREVLR
jgi:hypothetical protein